MAITKYEQMRTGIQTQVMVQSDLTGTVYYHWYLDGGYLGYTTTPYRSFTLPQDDQSEFAVVDTTDASFDPVANAPTHYTAKRPIWWVRSAATDVDYYRVDQKKGAGEWEQIGVVYEDATHWDYQVTTPRLDDLGTYTWRVVPVDTIGNEGTALTIGPELIVRTPDAPEVTITYDEGTDKVTIAEAT